MQEQPGIKDLLPTFQNKIKGSYIVYTFPDTEQLYRDTEKYIVLLQAAIIAGELDIAAQEIPCTGIPGNIVLPYRGVYSTTAEGSYKGKTSSVLIEGFCINRKFLIQPFEGGQ